MDEVDMDAQRKQRIAKWLREQPDGDDVDVITLWTKKIPQLLLDFWKFLDACEVERMLQ
jgi:hypothetical protein